MRGRGKKRALSTEQERQVVKMYSDTPNVPVAQIAIAFGVCRKTIYNVLARARESAAQVPDQLAA